MTEGGQDYNLHNFIWRLQAQDTLDMIKYAKELKWKKTKNNAIYLHITKFFFLQNPHFCLLMWQCQNMILRTSRLYRNSVDPVSQKQKHFWISFWLLHSSNVSDFSWPQERYTILNEENLPRFNSEIKHCLITIILHSSFNIVSFSNFI